MDLLHIEIHFFALQIHSDSAPSPDAVVMDRPRRSKRKTSESLPLENGTPAKEKGSKSKKKNKEQLTEITELTSPKLKETSVEEPMEISDLKKKRRSSKKSPSKVQDSMIKNMITAVNGAQDSNGTPKRSSRKTSESHEERVPSPSPEVNHRGGRKASESSVGSNRKNSESFDPPPASEKPSAGTKRKNSESGKTEALSVADRIKLLSHEQNQKATPPRTDSVLQLLLQGLNNKDSKILETVLERADDELIRNTVKRLPIEAVVPLLEVLHHYIQVN